MSGDKRPFFFTRLHAPLMARSRRPTRISALRPFAKDLQLNATKADRLRTSMVQDGLLLEEKVGRSSTFAITDKGVQELEHLKCFIPLQPAKGNVSSGDNFPGARQAFVLGALARAPGQRIERAALDAAFGGKPKLSIKELARTHPDVALFRDQHCLALNPATIIAVLTELVINNDVEVHRTSAVESYSLTPSGSDRLALLRNQWPILPPSGKPTRALNESIRLGREAFLLIKMLESENHVMNDAAVRSLSYPKPIKLNHATAWQVRAELVQSGHLQVSGSSDGGQYALTLPGQHHLTMLPFDVLGEVKIKGSTLTELLHIARNCAQHLRNPKRRCRPKSRGWPRRPTNSRRW